LLNVILPQVTVVAFDAPESVALPVSVHGKGFALATASESNEKANSIKNLFIAFPPNRIL
jgi:hypothetical protein